MITNVIKICNNSSLLLRHRFAKYLWLSALTVEKT